MGRTQISLSQLNSSNIGVGNVHSTETDWFKKEVSYDSIMMTFTICIKTSTLTKTSHYTGYQQKLFDEIKRLKDIEGYGYKRISYMLYEKGYRSIRTDSILRYNYIFNLQEVKNQRR
tara:strand:+ start:899 stop:1249 length:351 start_codon:yes stop_codon:yes gene_type:complete